MTRISSSVGRDGANQRDDVKMVQRLLNQQVLPGAPPPLAVDGIAGPGTIERIELFQRAVLGYSPPDGRVDPDAATIERLAANADGGRQDPAGMEPSDDAIDLLKSIEGLRLQPYDDHSGEPIDEWVAGATVGYGHLIGRNEWDRYQGGVTGNQAEALLESDLEPFARAVRSEVRRRLFQQEFDALLILVFNIGTGAFASSSVLKLINDPDADTGYDSLEAAWKAWNKSQGRVMEGLVKRRACEWRIYSEGRYETWW